MKSLSILTENHSRTGRFCTAFFSACFIPCSDKPGTVFPGGARFVQSGAREYKKELRAKRLCCMCPPGCPEHPT
jgi:hypothetical protein